MTGSDQVHEIKFALTDVRRVCDALGLTRDGGKTVLRQAAGLIVRCPVHEDRTPSCSVQLREGVLLWRCHGCGSSGDVLTLIGAVRGIPLSGVGFREVLIEGARLAGLWGLVDELEGRASFAERPRPAPTLPQAAPEPPRAYPDGVDAFWANLGPVDEDQEVSGYLWSRAINPTLVTVRDLARVLPVRGSLPEWARCRGGSWRDASYRLIVPMFNADGILRSVRGWRIGGLSVLPKRIPPSGCKASGLVMADEFGQAMLRGTISPERVVIAEGEPDFATWAARLNDPTTATLGIISGSWSTSFAAKIPIGAHVDVRTDRDEAGERYYAEIYASLRRRTPDVFRSVEVRS
jgi:CHC2-type zinc finger protein